MSVPCGWKELRLPLSLLAFLFLLAGCAGHPPPMRAGPAPRNDCPPPMVWSQGVERPRRLRLTNETDAPVSVWLDSCFDHLRLGNVDPGKTRLLPLPHRLIPYSDQLHLHVFDLDGLFRVGSYAVDLEPSWTLALAVEPYPEEWEAEFGDDAHLFNRFEGLNGFLVYPGEVSGFASRWAEDTPAVLTWQCVGDEKNLTLTDAGRGSGKVPVEVIYSGTGGRTFGEWNPHRGGSGILGAPNDVVEEVTLMAPQVEEIEVLVGEGEAVRSHIFRLNGFLETKKALKCLRGK